MNRIYKMRRFKRFATAMPFLLPSLSKRVHWQKKIEGGAPSPGLDGAHTPPHSYIKFQEQNEFLMDIFGTNHSLIQNA